MDFVISPVMQSPNSSDTCISKTSAYNLETFLAERRLIRLVRKRSALYNRHHRRFKDYVFKEQLWQTIARKMSLELSKCISTWVELRYKYQRHVRRLRSYRRKVQTCRNQAHARPIMLHEEELLFLYTHVAQLPLQPDQRTNVHDLEATSVDDDVIIVNHQPAIVIDVEEYCDQHKISSDQQRLIDAVRAYPQLYDTQHLNYANYRHRGLIWGAISNELHEKATKLMKIWLQLTTRYEWESLHCNSSSSSSQLLKQLSFLDPHIRNTPNTVCKMSMYLKDAWFDTIEHFRSVVNLIDVLKTMPELGQMVEDSQDQTQKPTRYHELWLRVSAQVNCSSQRCEVTWLVLRNFYLELAEMRKIGYQLQDKWFFEKIIGCLYKLLAKKRAASNVAKVTTPPKLRAHMTGPASLRDWPKMGSSLTCSTPQPVQPLPLAIVYPAITRSPNTPISAIPINSSSSNTVTNSIAATTNTNRSSGGACSTSGFAMPRITAAISVVAKPAPTAAPLTVAPVATIANSNYLSKGPKPLALPIPATVQLATVPGVRPGLPRTGLHVTVKPGMRLPLTPRMPPVIGSTSNSAIRSIRGATIIRPVAPAPAGTIVTTTTTTTTQEPRPISKVANWSSILAAATPPSTIKLGPPLPKLVPLTVCKDTVKLPSKKIVLKAPSTTMPMPTLTPRMLLRKQPNTVCGYPALPIKISSASSSMNSKKPKLLPSSPQPPPPPSMVSLPIQKTTCPPDLCVQTPSECDIKVEFRDCPTMGRIIHVEGATVLYSPNLTMARVAIFIREVMAIPQLHMTETHSTARSTIIWQQISRKYHMPGKC